MRIHTTVARFFDKNGGIIHQSVRTGATEPVEVNGETLYREVVEMPTVVNDALGLLVAAREDLITKDALTRRELVARRAVDLAIKKLTEQDGVRRIAK